MSPSSFRDWWPRGVGRNSPSVDLRFVDLDAVQEIGIDRQYFGRELPYERLALIGSLQPNYTPVSRLALSPWEAQSHKLVGSAAD